MKLKMLAGALALALALPAVAQAPMGAMNRADFMARGKAQLDIFDTNHDGNIGREELTAGRRALHHRSCRWASNCQ